VLACHRSRSREQRAAESDEGGQSNHRPHCHLLVSGLDRTRPGHRVGTRSIAAAGVGVNPADLRGDGPRQTTGGRIHDARVAAICLSHGVRTLLSADRDFSRFPELDVDHPLVG
jgi:hypothetical protein